jgi:purine catabolism regulator
MTKAGSGTSATDVHRMLARPRAPYLLLHRDGVLYVVASTHTVEDHLLATLPQPTPVLGVSAVIANANRVPDAAQEARWALGVAAAENRTMVRYGDHTTLLLPQTPTEARALVDRVLRGLIAQDGEHGTDYLETLRAMLRHDRSWQSAAAELHIHKQTLGYRIRKIESITGRGLTRTEDLAEWWLALRAYDLLEGRHLD